MRVLVCGGRNFDDYEFVRETLYEFCDERGLVLPREGGSKKNLTVVHGGARGADRAGDEWAIINEVPVEEYRADWDQYGKAAGVIRNKQMLDTGIDVVIAFPGGKGTAHMKKIAREAGVEVIEVG